MIIHKFMSDYCPSHAEEHLIHPELLVATKDITYLVDLDLNVNVSCRIIILVDGSIASASPR